MPTTKKLNGILKINPATSTWFFTSNCEDAQFLALSKRSENLSLKKLPSLKEKIKQNKTKATDMANLPLK